ncbi:MAG: DUF2341 domain-containing protein, partial [Bacteroidota bacterium]
MISYFKWIIVSFKKLINPLLLFTTFLLKGENRKTVIFCSFLISGLLFSQYSKAQLFNDYGFRKTITIPAAQMSGSDAHSDFPLLISIALDDDLRNTANGGYVENMSGYDIVFSTDETATLDHEIEKYDPSTGDYIAWVRIPSLAPTVDFTFYMYFGNPDVNDDPSTTLTWNASYEGIWHLHDDFNDATANGINGTNNNSTNITGLIGDAQNFDASSSY